MVDPATKMPKFIDFGHSDFYRNGMIGSLGIGTGFYKAPELLVNYYLYDFGVDIWAVGCMFAQMLFKIKHFFRPGGHGEYERSEQLAVIAEVLGTQAVVDYAAKYHLQIEQNLQWVIKASYPKKEWQEFVNEGNERYMSEEAFDLLTKLLTLDHAERITARDALEHPYFKSIREMER